MRIAIPSVGKGLESAASPVFGRAPGFVIVELNGNEIVSYNYLENPGANAWRGAGVATAQAIINAGVNVVIASSVGPNSFEILRASNIKIYQGTGTVKELIDKFLSGSLPEMQAPTGRGFGFGRGWGRRWR